MCDKEKPRVSDITVTFTQEPDTSDGQSVISQEIEVEAIDSGNGFFFRIKTERWAFDDPKELTDLVKRVKKMLER